MYTYTPSLMDLIHPASYPSRSPQSTELSSLYYTAASYKLLFYTYYCVSVQFNSVTQSCPTLCNPMNCSTPGLPVHHQLPEFTQTHIYRVSDAIQPFHPLSSPSPLSFSLFQYQSFPVSQLFASGGQRTGVSHVASFLPKKSQG